MSTHTPGPWSFTRKPILPRPQGSPEAYFNVTGVDADLGFAVDIATVYPGLDDGAIGGETEANARLIAAAPEMLAVLTLLIDLCPRMSDDDPAAPVIAEALSAARAVVAKATHMEGER